MEPSALVREARLAAGLTQAQLAERTQTTQTAVARLERRGSNPTVATLDRALRASNRRLALSSTPAPLAIDVDQLDAQLRLTPAERVSAHRAAYENMAALLSES